MGFRDLGGGGGVEGGGVEVEGWSLVFEYTISSAIFSLPLQLQAPGAWPPSTSSKISNISYVGTIKGPPKIFPLQ